jgi:hypothetical protein
MAGHWLLTPPAAGLALRIFGGRTGRAGYPSHLGPGSEALDWTSGSSLSSRSLCSICGRLLLHSRVDGPPVPPALRLGGGLLQVAAQVIGREGKGVVLADGQGEGELVV